MKSIIKISRTILRFRANRIPTGGLGGAYPAGDAQAATLALERHRSGQFSTGQNRHV